MKTTHTFKNRTEVWTKSNDKTTSKVIGYKGITKKNGLELFDHYERLIYQEIVYHDNTIERKHFTYQLPLAKNIKDQIIFKDKKGVITITNISYSASGDILEINKKKYIPNRIFK